MRATPQRRLTIVATMAAAWKLKASIKHRVLSNLQVCQSWLRKSSIRSVVRLSLKLSSPAEYAFPFAFRKCLPKPDKQTLNGTARIFSWQTVLSIERLDTRLIACSPASRARPETFLDPRIWLQADYWSKVLHHAWQNRCVCV